MKFRIGKLFVEIGWGEPYTFDWPQMMSMTRTEEDSLDALIMARQSTFWKKGAMPGLVLREGESHNRASAELDAKMYGDFDPYKEEKNDDSKD